MAIEIPEHIERDLQSSTTEFKYFVVINPDGDINSNSNRPIFLSSSADYLEHDGNKIVFLDRDLRLSKLQESVDYRKKKIKISNCSISLSNYKVGNSRLSDDLEDAYPTVSTLQEVQDGSSSSMSRVIFAIYLKTRSCKTLDDCLQLGLFKVVRYSYDEKVLTIEGMDEWLNTFYTNLPKLKTNITGEEVTLVTDDSSTLEHYIGRYIPILYGHLESAPAVPYIEGIGQNIDYLENNMIKILPDDAYLVSTRPSRGVHIYSGAHEHAESYASSWTYGDRRTRRNIDNMNSLQVGLGNQIVNIPILPHRKNMDAIRELWTYPQYMVGSKHPNANYDISNSVTGYRDHVSLMTNWYGSTKVQEGVMWCSEICQPQGMKSYFLAMGKINVATDWRTLKEYHGTTNFFTEDQEGDTSLSPYFRYKNNYLSFRKKSWDIDFVGAQQMYTKPYLGSACVVYNDTDNEDIGLNPFIGNDIVNNGDTFDAYSNSPPSALKAEIGIEHFQFSSPSFDASIHEEWTYDYGVTKYPEDFRILGRHKISQESIYATYDNEKWLDYNMLPFSPRIDPFTVDAEQYNPSEDTTVFPSEFLRAVELELIIGSQSYHREISEDLLSMFPYRFRQSGFLNSSYIGYGMDDNQLTESSSHFYPIDEDTNSWKMDNTFADELSEVYTPGINTTSLCGYYSMSPNTQWGADEDNYMGINNIISEWLGIEAERTWAQKSIFSNDFFCNAYGKVASEVLEVDQDYAPEITQPKRFRGVVWLPWISRGYNWNLSSNAITNDLNPHQNKYSEGDNNAFWILHSLLTKGEKRIPYKKTPQELMFWGRDSSGGDPMGDIGLSDAYESGSSMDFNTYPGEREFLFYDIKFLEVVDPEIFYGGAADNNIEPPILTTTNGAASNNTWAQQTSINGYVGIKFEATMLTKEAGDGASPPEDLHHISSHHADYYGLDNLSGGSAIWDLKLGYGTLEYNEEGKIKDWNGFYGGYYHITSEGESKIRENIDGLSVYEWNLFNRDFYFSEQLDEGTSQGTMSHYSRDIGMSFIRELPKSGWDNDGTWQRNSAYETLENPLDITYDILTNELNYDNGFTNRNYFDMKQDNRFIKLAFSIHESKSSKDILETIARHSTFLSYFSAVDQQFKLIPHYKSAASETSQSRTYGFVNHTIYVEDLTSVKVNKSNPEDLVLSVTAKYGYNYLTGEYDKTLSVGHIDEDTKDNYISYYNIENEENHVVELEFEYIHDKMSAYYLADFYFQANKNQKVECEIQIPLKYGLSIELGDTINLEKKNSYTDFMNFYGMDITEIGSYTILDQNVSRDFRVVSITKKGMLINLKCVQNVIVEPRFEKFHNGIDFTQSAWEFPGIQIPNYGYGAYSDSSWTDDYPDQMSGVSYDYNNDGVIDVLDVVSMVGVILGNNVEPTGDLFDQVDGNSDGTIDVLDIVGAVNVILGN